LGADSESTQRASQLMMRTMIDAFAMSKPIRGVLLKVARMVIRNKTSEPPITERRHIITFSQRLGDLNIMTKTGMVQKNKPHSLAYLTLPLAD
jgi:hypothetical protein